MNFKVLGCQPLRRELYMLAALSPHEMDLELLPPDAPAELLQQKINAETNADYVILAMGECLTVGICSASRPLVIPRVHNCPHMLLGSTERFHRAFSENEDSPSWQTTPQCSKCKIHRGAPCAVRSSLPGAVLPDLPLDAKEYAADLTLLKKLLDGLWEDDYFLIIPPQSRVVGDPVEILAAEPA